MNRQTKTTLAVIAAAVLGSIAVHYTSNWLDGGIVQDVQSGSVVLSCDTGEGMKRVEPSKVAGLVDGMWIFVNGAAKQCEVSK